MVKASDAKPAARKPVPRWTLYILHCGDGSLYTGITNDLEKRLAAHRAGKGAKYTRGRGPLVLLHTESFRDKSRALKREIAVKSLPRLAKLALVLAPSARRKRSPGAVTVRR